MIELPVVIQLVLAVIIATSAVIGTTIAVRNSRRRSVVSLDDDSIERLSRRLGESLPSAHLSGVSVEAAVKELLADLVGIDTDETLERVVLSFADGKDRKAAAEAEAAADRFAAKADPRNASDALLLSALGDSGRTTQERLAALRRAARLAPDNPHVLNIVGTSLLATADYEEALEALHKATAVSAEMSDEELKAQSLANLGVAQTDADLFALAQESFAEALSYYEPVGHLKGQAVCLAGMARLRWVQRDLEASRELFQKSLSIERQLKDWKGIARDLNSLGTLHMTLWNYYHRVADLDRAEEYFMEGTEIFRSLQDPEGMARIKGNHGMLFSNRVDVPGTTPETREALLSQAEKLVSSGLELAETHELRRVRAEQLSNMGVVKEDQGLLDEAVAFWRKAREAYLDLGLPGQAAEMDKWIREAGG